MVEEPSTPDGGRVLVQTQQELNCSTLALLEYQDIMNKEVEPTTCVCPLHLSIAPISHTGVEHSNVPFFGLHSTVFLSWDSKETMFPVLCAMCLLDQL